MITKADLLQVLRAYVERYPAQRAKLEPLEHLITDRAAVTSRTEFRGHVTCGAVAINEAREALMIQHNALDRWLMPGGHVEPEDRTLLDGALRELTEETGVSLASVTVPARWLHIPVDIDRHGIPANLKKGEPAHEHWDFRFLLFVPKAAGISVDANEVGGWRWGATDPAMSGIVEKALQL